ncbi:MAG: DNA repair exonuclease [Clostridia bacterium]|nr:DNA repair exonuclease [Clostridia bacterium]
MASFVHSADIHLDTPFSANLSTKQMQIRRKEIMQTFKKLVLASADKDFLFLSGDLFDGGYVSSDTIEFVKRCFGEIPDTKVFISAGNHDPLTSNSVYLTEEFGDNVHIFGSEMEYVDFPELKTRIHGVSFADSRQETTLLSKLEIKDDWCNILVIHGDIVANGGESVYNPIEKGALAGCGADYVALGHIHIASGLQRAENTWYAYSGVPEGRGFDEEGEKGFYVGEAEKGRVYTEWVGSSARAFHHTFFDVSGISDSIELYEKIKAEIKDENNLYKVVLNGKARRGLINLEIIKEQLKNSAFYIDIIDKTSLGYEIDEIAKENSLRGAFVREMLEKITLMDEKEIGYMALEFGLSAMEGGENR